MLKKLYCNRDKIFLISIIFVLHAILSFFKKGVYLSTDEMGVVATSAFFVGEDWSSIVHNIPYYGFGQAVLYIPIFKLISNPQLRFMFMGILNSLILSCIPLILFEILHKYVGLNRKKAITYSFIGSIFPGTMTYTKWVWNEVLLYVLPIIVIYIILLLLKKDKYQKTLSCLLAFFSVYSYAVHGRGIALIFSVFFMILYIKIIYRRNLINNISFIISFGISYWIYKIIKEYLLDNLWKVSDGQIIGNTLGAVIKSALSKDTMAVYVKTFCGQLYAGVFSTYGLMIITFLFIIVFIYYKVFNKKKYINEEIQTNMYFNIFIVYSVVTFLLAFMISVIFLGGGLGDYLIYTRYFSNMLVLITLIALILINEYGIFKKKKILLMVLLLIFSSFSFIIKNDVNFARPFVFLNIYPYLGFIEGKELITINISIMLIFFVILTLSYKKKKFTCIFIIIVFLQSYMYSSIRCIMPSYINTYNLIHEYSEIVNSINRLSNKYNKIYYYDDKNYKAFTDSALQFELNKFSVQKLTGDTDEVYKKISNNSLIISTEDMCLERYGDKFYRLNGNGINQKKTYMWVYGDDIKEYIEENSNIKFKNSELKTIINGFENFTITNSEKIGNSLYSNGDAGPIIYGPYIKLLKGNYLLRITGEILKSENNDIGNIDVVYNGAKNIILPQVKISDFIKQEKLDCEVRFTLDNDVDLSEIRVILNEGSIIRIDNIVLETN